MKLNKQVDFDKEIDIPVTGYQSPVSSEKPDSQLSQGQNCENAESESSNNAYVTRSGRVSRPPDRLDL